MSAFVFVACREGAEPWLKAELAVLRPSWRLAFSRPGFVTFKVAAPDDTATPLSSVFARAWGDSIGPVDGVDPAALAIRDALAAQPTPDGAPPYLFVAPRSAGAWAELDAPARAAIAEADAALRAALAREGVTLREGAPPAGARVFDVFLDASRPCFVGAHVASPAHSPYPRGLLPVELPADAPSRAYLKLEEAALEHGLDLRPGQTALELGSAPGGATFALLRRGVSVVGVDPGEMDARVRDLVGPGGARLTHLKEPAGALKRTDLPRPCAWVVVDMNLAPAVSLRYTERVVGPLKKGLKGLVLTLKLNDDAAARSVPALVARVRSFGFDDVRATQLPSNRREISVVALAKGAAGATSTPRRAR